jgi:hypothetical protein
VKEEVGCSTLSMLKRTSVLVLRTERTVKTPKRFELFVLETSRVFTSIECRVSRVLTSKIVPQAERAAEAAEAMAEAMTDGSDGSAPSNE